MEMNKVNADVQASDQVRSPSGFSILWREIVRDKVALISLILLILTCMFVYGISLFLDQGKL